MKKILILSLLGISLCLANECPDLSKGEKDPLNKLKIVETMKKNSAEYVAYASIIRHYNKTNEHENYFDIQELKRLSETKIFDSVLKEVKKGNTTKEEEEKYLNFLRSIDKKDKEWCNKTL